jgi:hypothetical protein
VLPVVVELDKWIRRRRSRGPLALDAEVVVNPRRALAPDA